MVDLDSLAPMLLDERPLNLEEPGWIQELKYDVSFVKKLSKSRSSPTGLDCAIPHRILKACRLADLERHCAHSAVRNCKLSTVQLSLLRAVDLHHGKGARPLHRLRIGMALCACGSSPGHQGYLAGPARFQ
jgi:hypothetical protein